MGMRRLRLYTTVGLLLILFQIAGYLLLSFQRHIPVGKDAWSYIAAARAIMQGISPYDRPLNSFLPEAQLPVAPYLYPPLLTLEISPIANLPLIQAIGIWMLVVAISHAVLIGLLKQFVGWKIAIIAALAWLPTWQGAY